MIGAGKIDNEINEEIHKVNHKTGNGIRKSDKNEGEDEVGKSRLNVNDCLGVYFGAKHNHKTDNQEDENIDGVGQIAKDLPESDNGRKHTVAGSLGVDDLGSGQANVFHKMGQILLGRSGAFNHKVGNEFGLNGKNSLDIGIGTTFNSTIKSFKDSVKSAIIGANIFVKRHGSIFGKR